jgi:hypothetical protein
MTNVLFKTMELDMTVVVEAGRTELITLLLIDAEDNPELVKITVVSFTMLLVVLEVVLGNSVLTVLFWSTVVEFSGRNIVGLGVIE